MCLPCGGGGQQKHGRRHYYDSQRLQCLALRFDLDYLAPILSQEPLFLQKLALKNRLRQKGLESDDDLRKLLSGRPDSHVVNLAGLDEGAEDIYEKDGAPGGLSYLLRIAICALFVSLVVLFTR